MKPLLTLLITLTATVAFGADVKLGWTNGDNPSATAAWQTIVYVGLTASVSPTNYISAMTVSWPATTATVTNLQAGIRYYFTVAHTDLEDVSDPSNTVAVKTKINPPKNASVIP